MIKMIMSSNKMTAANTKRAMPHPGTQSLLPPLPPPEVAESVGSSVRICVCLSNEFTVVVLFAAGLGVGFPPFVV